MDLFENIPENLFSIFNSKNKSIYIKTLFLIKRVFNQELIIEKKTLVKQIGDSLIKDISFFVEEENEGRENLLSKNNSKTNSIIKKLLETGWIELEYGMDTDFKEFIAIPPYSIKIINTLFEIMEDEAKEYNSYMYSVYSNLKQADENKKDFMFSALKNAYEKTKQLEDELKSLFHNIRRKHNKLSFLNNVNEVLKDHFDDYQRKVVKQIYLPMKTKDSLNRFKGNIIKILSSWLRNPIELENLEKQALSSQSFSNVEDSKEDIINKIYFVVDKFHDLESMIEKIDEKNKQYISATTEKMRFLLNKDTSITSKIIRILEKLENNYDNEKVHQVLNENISIFRQGYYNDTSFFIRSASSISFDSPPLELDSDISENIDFFADELVKRVDNIFSHKNIILFMEEQLKDKNQIHIKDISINTSDDLIFTIQSTIKGWDKNVFYKIQLEDGKSKNMNYLVPNLKYIRRRKI